VQYKKEADDTWRANVLQIAQCNVT